MSNNFDTPIVLDTAGVSGGYIGWGRAQGTAASTKARIYNGPSLAAFDGIVSAPPGSIAICDNGQIIVNDSTTDPGTAWSGLGAKNLGDPGDAAAIPINVSGYVPLVTDGAETRTLAAPSFIGQELLLFLDTDGGNCTVTVSAAINAADENTLVFNDAGDFIALVGISIGGVLRWRVKASDGVQLSVV